MRWLGWLVAGFLVLGGLAEADSPGLGAQNPTALPKGIEVRPPEGGAAERISINLRSDKTLYTVGDPIRLSVRTSHNALIYVFVTDNRGETRQLLPNFYDDRHFVRAGDLFRLPSTAYELVASRPGSQTITVRAVGASGHHDGYIDTFTKPSATEPYPKRSSVPDSTALQRQRSGTGLRSEGRQSLAEEGAGVSVESGARVARSSGTATLRIRVQAAPGGGGTGGSGGSGGGSGGGGNALHPHESGTLSITGSPSRSEIWIGGFYYGTIPKEVRLAPGRYEVEIRKDGYLPALYDVRIREQRRERLSVRLRRD
jgi:hypothetical protein